MLYNSNGSDFIWLSSKAWETNILLIRFAFIQGFHELIMEYKFPFSHTLSNMYTHTVYTGCFINFKFLCIMTPPNILCQQGTNRISDAGCLQTAFFIVTLKFNETQGSLWTHRQMKTSQKILFSTSICGSDTMKTKWCFAWDELSLFCS